MSEPPPDRGQGLSDAANAATLDFEEGPTNPRDEDPSDEGGYFVEMPKDDTEWALDPEQNAIYDPRKTVIWVNNQREKKETTADGPETGSKDPMTPVKRIQDSLVGPDSSTPFRPSSQNQLSTLDEMKEIILKELGSGFYVVTRAWVSNLYNKQAPLEKIMSFLNCPSNGYKKSTWGELPRAPAREDQIYDPLFKIIGRIIKAFSTSDEDGVSREILNTNNVFLKHDNGDHDTAPDFCIKSAGPSFETPLPQSTLPSQRRLRVGWSNVCSVFEVKRDKKRGQITAHAKQVSLYCRQILIHQPNRKFVRLLIITEEAVRLVHFDRSGLYFSPYVDIHEDPYTFVKLVAGLTACDEEILGLDTSIQWTIDKKTGRKIAGTIEAPSKDGDTAFKYNLCMKTLPFVRPSVRGRGTTCYRAVDPTSGEVYVIKDSWRTESRNPEIEYLKAAHGLDGVVQSIAYQDDCAQTSSFRPKDAGNDSDPEFFNRVKSRVVMENHGGPLESFKSRSQLIAAFRDTILGHQNLLLKGVLHRDIGVHNILLGSLNAAPGKRGIIIDLDMAMWIARSASSKINDDYRTGLQRFHSIASLLRKELALVPPHDFWDDLESFFYVLLFILLMYERPGVLNGDRDSDLSRLFSDTEVRALDTAAKAKNFLLSSALPGVSEWWGDACDELLQEYQEVLLPVCRRKGRIRKSKMSAQEHCEPSTRGKPPVWLTVEKHDRLEEIGDWEKSASTYKTLEEAFDKALSAIRREEDREANGSPLGLVGAHPQSSPSPAERDPQTRFSAIVHQAQGRPTVNSLKRRSNSVHPDVAHAKRSFKNIRKAHPLADAEAPAVESSDDDS